MGASSILFPCYFVLILFGPIVYGENLRNGALPKLGEMQRFESFSGRKYGYTHSFSTREKLVTVLESRKMEERSVLVQRRLLAEDTTMDEGALLQKPETKKAKDKTEHRKKLQIQAVSSKGSGENGQNSTKPEDGSVKEIPVKETIHPEHSAIGGKGNNVEISETKVEKLKDAEKLNNVQQSLKNSTEKSTNNGSENTTKDESPLLLKIGIKKGEDETELGKKVQIQAASSKRTEEISLTPKKPKEGSVKEIPVMETIQADRITLGEKDKDSEISEAKKEKIRDGVKVISVQKPLENITLGGKDKDAEISKAKKEKIRDGMKFNSVQKPLENRTEQNNNNGSVNASKDESPLLQKTETKNTEDQTEQGKQSQIRAASSNVTEEITQNPIKAEDGIEKEITVTEDIHTDHSTSGGKDSNAERSEAKKELQGAEKVNSVQKPSNNGTEHNTNNGGENIRGGPAEDTEKITEAETLPNATEAQTHELQNMRNSAETGQEISERNEAQIHPNSAESQGIGSGKAANATGTEVQKMESEEARSLTDSANLQKQKTIDEMQKEQGTEAEGIANSSHPEMPGKTETLTGFKYNERHNIDSTENDSSSISTDAENEQMESSEAEALSNSTESDIQQAETLDSTEKAQSAESETFEQPELKQAEILEDSRDTMASTEFQGSTNSTATEMPWEAQNSTNNKDVEIQVPEDEYNDLIQEITDLPSKFHDTAEKVADQLMPGIQKLSNRSKIYLSIANEEIAHGFRPLVGQHYAPFVASGISCIFLMLPVLVAIVVFEQIRSFFPLQKVILLANIYMANYFAALVLTSFIIRMEPMEFFFKNSLSVYIYMQLLQGLGFLLYLSMQCFNVVAICSRRTILLAKLASAVQLFVAVCISLHYYVTVFNRAMAQKPPRTCWRVHGVYSLLFGILCLLSRIRHAKKEYVQVADYNTDKKN